MGGIVGQNVHNSHILNCINYGDVTNTGGGYATGGVVGVNSGWDINQNKYTTLTRSTIDGCGSCGNVTSNGLETGGIIGGVRDYTTNTSNYYLYGKKTKYNSTEATDMIQTSSPYLGTILGSATINNSVTYGAGGYFTYNEPETEDDTITYTFVDQTNNNNSTDIEVSGITYWIMNNYSDETSTIWSKANPNYPTLLWENN